MSQPVAPPPANFPYSPSPAPPPSAIPTPVLSTPGGFYGYSTSPVPPSSPPSPTVYQPGQTGYIPVANPPLPTQMPSPALTPAGATGLIDLPIGWTGSIPIINASHLPPPTGQLPAPPGLVSPEITSGQTTGSLSRSPVLPGRVNFFRVWKSEWIKLFTLRSTWWILAMTIAATVGLGVIIMTSLRLMATQPFDIGVSLPPQTIRASDGSGVFALAQLVLAVLAVLVATNEYSSGQIRSTFSAVPARTPTLIAKVLTVALTSGVAIFIATYGAALASWIFISDLGQPGKPLPPGWELIDDRFTIDGLLTIAGITLATVLVMIFAFAVGMLTRNTAASIATVVIILLLMPILLNVMHWEWVSTLHQYMLDASQNGLLKLPKAVSSGDYRDFIQALWVTSLWAFGPTLFAGILLKVRDA